MSRVIRFLVLSIFLFIIFVPASAQGSGEVIRLLDRNAREITRLVDGSRVSLSVKLPAPAEAELQAEFLLEGLDTPLAVCTLAPGAQACSSEPFSALGWFWGAGGVPMPGRVIRVRLGGQQSNAALEITIKPRPVVMVHGFISSWETWEPYLGPGGYLASIGLQGFAVGDGRAPGVLNTGSPSNPAGRTNSIAQNADVLKNYIASVQEQTGAEKVDLLVHSMGGMISRYYLDRVMDNENVAQVIFLGTPMSGTACIYPVAALGFLMPASLEILPDYMTNIFNRQVVHRRGIPFYMVAGTLLIDPLTSPCTAAPSDTVVGLDSATSIQLDDVQQLPLFHGSLTAEKEVFDRNVIHLLKNQPATFAPRPDLEAPAVTTAPEQFSRAYTGHINPGESPEVTINIDPNVSLANFSLYDSSRSLDVEVRGASGNVLSLDPAANGVLRIDDPETMIYLGYGFKQPKPGKWVIRLVTGPQTPPQGADYAINARFVGGATLSANSSPTIPTLGQPVSISASLQVAGASLTIESAEARIRKPDGSQETLPLSANGDSYGADYRPDQSGLHAVEVVLMGINSDGFSVDRAAFLTFEVQPGGEEIKTSRSLILAAAVGLILLLAALLFLIFRLRKPRKG